MKIFSSVIYILLLVVFFNQSIKSQSINLIDENTALRVLVPDATVRSNWRTALTFDDSQWIEGSGGIGYGANYEQYIKINVGEKMYRSGGDSDRSCLVRIKFNLTEEQLQKAKRLMLTLRYDDGLVIYLNSVQVFSRNAPASPKFNSLATGENEAEAVPQPFHLTFNLAYQVYNSAITYLRSGENLLTIQGFNIAANDPDFLLTLKLVLETFGEPPILESSNLPIIVINTNNVPIPNDTRITADMGVIDNGGGQRNKPSDQFNNYNGKISIEVHGSSSESFPKKSFSIETQDNSGNNNNFPLLGLPAENDWILYSAYTDKTLMRDVLMYRLSNLMGRYASRYRYCEVILNGVYNGVYVLLEKVKRDKNRVDIANLDEDDLQGDSLTGGYIIKLDQPDINNDYFVSAFPPYPNASQRIQYQYHYPKDDEIKDEQKQYIKNFMDEFENVMNGDNYDDPANGYSKYIDENSFVDNFLLNEICKNVDGYRLSSFFYKNRDEKGGKLCAGPIWDMNFSLGNAGYYAADSTEGWEIDEMSLGVNIRNDLNLPPFWWEKLIHEPRFTNLINERWQTLRAGVLGQNFINSLIDAYADTLRESQERNFQIYSGPGDAGRGFWVTPVIFYSFNTYQDEVDYLKKWISDRMNWIDQNVSRLTSVDDLYTRNIPDGFSLLQNYPNPFNPVTIIRYVVKANAANGTGVQQHGLFQRAEMSNVKLIVYDILGNEVATLVNEYKFNGEYNVEFKADNLSSGVYMYVLKTPYSVQARKMMLLK